MWILYSFFLILKFSNSPNSFPRESVGMFSSRDGQVPCWPQGIRHQRSNLAPSSFSPFFRLEEAQDSSPGWWHSPRHQTPSPLYVSITNLKSHNSKAGEEEKSVPQHQWANTLMTTSKDYQLNSLHNRGISLYLLSIRNQKNGMKKSQEDMSKVLLQ